MRTLIIIALCLVAVVSGAVVFWNVKYPSFTYRLRLTVAADVNGEPRTGSSVIEMEGQHQPPIGGAPSIYYRLHGEAVFVDLGNGRNVIATLGFGSNGTQDRMSSLAPVLFQTEPDDIPAKLGGSGRRAELTGEFIPTLVTFSDLNDPKTARVVRPDEFETVFGPGVRFKGAFIEMVPATEPVTRGIEAKLPWLRTFKGYLGGPFDGSWSRPSRNLTGNEFLKGL